MMEQFRDERLPDYMPPWNPPYCFIVGRQLKWDEEEVQALQFAAEPAVAYAYYKYLLDNVKGSVNESLFDHFLLDSFNRPALDYCKEAYDKVVAEGGTVSLQIKP